MIEALKHDEVITKLGGRFKLTALIQRRWLEVMRGARPMVDTQGRSDLEVVIQEIIEGKIEPKYWEEQLEDVYLVEKIGTKQGWSTPSPDEDWFTGYPQEMEAFYRAIAYGDPVESDSRLGADCISTIYSAYVSAEKAGTEVPVRAF